MTVSAEGVMSVFASVDATMQTNTDLPIPEPLEVYDGRIRHARRSWLTIHKVARRGPCKERHTHGEKVPRTSVTPGDQSMTQTFG